MAAIIKSIYITPLLKGNILRNERNHKLKDTTAIPIVFEKRYPLSKNFLKTIEAKGKKTIPMSNRLNHHLKT